MRLGTIVLQTRSGDAARQVWRDVEAAGFDVAYAADHLTHPALAGRWWADGWASVAAATGLTSRIELGTLVASAGVRTPTALARLSATVHDLSGGRFVLGLGAGTPWDVLADTGRTVDQQQLAGRYRETVAAVRAIYSGATSWQGRHVALDGLHTQPAPPGGQSPPLLLAAHAEQGFELVARYADGWSTFGGYASLSLSPDELWAVLREQSAAVTAACEAVGRDPATVRRSVLLGYGSERPLASVSAYEQAVESAQRNGFDELVVYWPDDSVGDRFAADPDVVAAAVSAVRGT